MSEPRSRRREPNAPRRNADSPRRATNSGRSGGSSGGSNSRSANGFGAGSGGSSDSSENASGNIGSNSNIREAVSTPTLFAALGVSSRVDAGLASAGFAAPFAIQTEAIPVALTGVDVCGRARTGSGKTLAFGVPMIDRATRDSQKAKPIKPRGVVLVPTRELAVQVTDVLSPIAQHCDVRVVAIYGGAARDKQVEQLVRGVEIIIATPLRLIDLMKNGEADLSDVEMIVLDEADRMADEGFMPQVEWVLRHITKEHQTMLFSATLDGQVATLVKRYMKSPQEISIDAPTDTVGTMRHLFLGVHHMDKNRVIAAMARAGGQTVVFCEKVSALHGDMAQGARERSLRKFAQGELEILVCTDVAARGIDIDDVGIVVHYVPPLEVKTYLHRSGRTARAGKDGWAVTLAEYNQHTTCRIIQRGLKLDAQAPIEVFSNDKRLADLGSFLKTS